MERFIPDQIVAELNEFMCDLRPRLQQHIAKLLNELHGLKVWLGVEVSLLHSKTGI